MTDKTFTLGIPGIPEIVWNSTRLVRDAFAGRFGPPETKYFAELADWKNPADAWRNIDRNKVLRFMRLANVPVAATGCRLIDLPVVTLIMKSPQGPYVSFPVDGNHRMFAREQMGFKDYSTFVVPPELEGEYRIRFTEF